MTKAMISEPFYLYKMNNITDIYIVGVTYIYLYTEQQH